MVVANFVLVETHFIGVLVDLILIFIVKSEVVKKVNQKFTGIAFIPFGDTRKQHDDECIGLQSSILRLIQFIVVGEILDDIEDGLKHGISFLLLENEVSNGSTVVITAVHHCDMDDSIPFSLGLYLSFDQRHPHVSIVEHTRLADACLLQLLVYSLQHLLGSEPNIVNIFLYQQEIDVGVLDP